MKKCQFDTKNQLPKHSLIGPDGGLHHRQSQDGRVHVGLRRRNPRPDVIKLFTVVTYK